MPLIIAAILAFTIIKLSLIYRNKNNTVKESLNEIKDERNKFIKEKIVQSSKNEVINESVSPKKEWIFFNALWAILKFLGPILIVGLLLSEAEKWIRHNTENFITGSLGLIIFITLIYLGSRNK